MFGIAFLKADPTTHIIHFSGGKRLRSGRALAFWYWRPSSVLVAVPTASREESMMVEERTSDHQAVVLSAAITFRVVDPDRLAEQLNHALDASGQHASEDPGRLAGRVVGIVQAAVRPLLKARSLRQALSDSEAIALESKEAIASAPGIQALGVEVQAFAVHGIHPTPELGRALEAMSREALQREADAAIAARREAAVAQDRAIREAELDSRRSTEARERDLKEAEQAFRLAQQREELEAQLSHTELEDGAQRALAALNQIAQLKLEAERSEAKRQADALAQVAQLDLALQAEQAQSLRLAQSQQSRLARERVEAEAQAEAMAKAQVEAIAREQEAAILVAAQAVNARIQAEAAAHALSISLAPLNQLDPRTLQALTASHGDARVVMAHAFQELAANAQKVGQLNLSPDLLQALLAPPAQANGRA